MFKGRVENNSRKPRDLTKIGIVSVLKKVSFNLLFLWGCWRSEMLLLLLMMTMMMRWQQVCHETEWQQHCLVRNYSLGLSIYSSLLISARWYNFEAVFIGFYLKCQWILLQWEQLYCSAIHSFLNWYLRQSQNRPWHVCEEGSEVSLLLFHTIFHPLLMPRPNEVHRVDCWFEHSLPLSKQGAIGMY